MQLSDDEATRVSKFLAQLDVVNTQVRNLMAQGMDVKDNVNTAFRDAHRGKQLEDEEFAERLGDNTVPPMINAMGQQVVKFNPKTRTATWETVHDAKRVAKKDEPDEESEVPNDTEESVKEEVCDETG